MNQFLLLLDKFIRVLFWGMISYFTYLIFLITIQYFPIDFDTAFLRIKQDEIILKHYQIAFFTHVYTSIFVLILGLFQISNWFRKKFTKWHKLMGKFYIGLILLAASPSGLLIGYYANGGWISQIGFMLLALFWFYFTFQAYLFTRKRDFVRHRKFMYRSFALTLSAITLRLLKVGVVEIWGLPPMDITRIIAWAGWLVNLILVEILFFIEKSRLKKLKSLV